MSYSLKIKKTNRNRIRLEPTIAKGHPTSIIDDQMINFLVRSLYDDMSLKSKSEAVRVAMPLLRCVGYLRDEGHVRAIADRSYQHDPY
jgi:hypothetical protein